MKGHSRAVAAGAALALLAVCVLSAPTIDTPLPSVGSDIITPGPNDTTTTSKPPPTTPPTPAPTPTPTTPPTTSPATTTSPTTTTLPTTTTPTTPVTSTTPTSPKTTPTTTSTPPRTTTVAPAPHKNGFNGPSFIGGIVLALGLVGIGFVGWKYYKARTEGNYRTL